MKIKRLLVAVCMLCIGLTLCSCDGVNDCVEIDSSGYKLPNMTRIGTGSGAFAGFNYLVDNDTGVVYLEYFGARKYGITPCYNSDGTLKTKDDIMEVSR